MKEKSLKEQINDAISQIPQQLVVLESALEPELLKEYFDKSSDVVPLDDDDTAAMQLIAQKLSDDTVDLNEKKQLLLQLAHTGSVDCYRTLESFMQVEQEPVLQKWALLALQECKLFLESELLDQSHGFILSGLGGLGNKLRYFFAVVAANSNTLTPLQQQTVKSEFESVCKFYRAEIEQVQFNPDFVSFTALIPIDVAVGDIIERAIEQCNELGNYLLTDFLITNMEIPTNDQLTDYIAEMRKPEDLHANEVEEDLLF